MEPHNMDSCSSPGRPGTAPNPITPTKDGDNFTRWELDGKPLQHPQQQQQSQQRIPTFKEFGETIKQLQHENFQLKVRLYLQENKNGRLQCQQTPGTSNSAPHESTPSAASIELVREFQNLRQSNETLQFKLAESENRNRSLQGQIEEGIKERDDLLERNDGLVGKLDHLERELGLMKLNKQKEDDIAQCVQAFNGDDPFYAAGNGHIHGPNSPQFIEFQRLRVEELEREQECWKADRFAFEEEIIILQEAQSKLVEKVKSLEEEIVTLRQEKTKEAEKLEEVITNLREDLTMEGHKLEEKDKTIEKQETQFLTTLKALQDMGVMYKTEEVKVKRLEAKVEEYKKAITRYKELHEKSEKTNLNTLKKNTAMTERLAMTKKVMDLLKTRLTELCHFFEALLELDSRGIVSLNSCLTERSRKELLVSLDQSQLLSDTLVQSLADNWDEEEKMEANKLKSSKLGQLEAELAKWTVEKPEKENVNANLLDGGDIRKSSAADVRLVSSKTQTSFALNGVKLPTAAKSIQCERDSEHNMETTSQINLLMTEKEKLEETKDRLVKEKGILYARVATLEANLNAIKELSYPLQIDELKTQIERKTAEKARLEKTMQAQSTRFNQVESDNQALRERLQGAESSLKRLQTDHTKLVTELNNMRASAKPFIPRPATTTSVTSEKSVKTGLNQEDRQDSSPDLGIESGHDALSVASGPLGSSQIKSSEEYQFLKSQNRELAAKLKHTKLALQKTIEKLNHASDEKEQFQKAVCRELHQTHHILRDAQVQVKVTDSMAAKLAEYKYN